jgi:cysteate synthase
MAINFETIIKTEEMISGTEALPQLAEFHQRAVENGKYVLKCAKCGLNIHANNFNFRCPWHSDALVRTSYSVRRIRLYDLPGLWRFYDWLPVRRINSCSGKSITYKSYGLAKFLGLKNLFIAFNGYWPERGAFVKTCTFKEFEAIVSIQYARDKGVSGPLVVASAGNTANAFAYVSSLEHYPVILVVPKRCLCDVWVPELDPTFVKIVVVEDGDYADAITLAKRLSALSNFAYEGGAANIARRDGLATVLLDAVVRIGTFPEHYFQAVGSGTGAIASYETVLRLVDSGLLGRIPKFHLSQNLPFVPMVKAWNENRREILPEDFPRINNVFDLVYARVLSNRYPPYSVSGGVYDILRATAGEMYAISNEEAIHAAGLFEESEGIDILPAAAVTVASLTKAVDKGKVNSTETVILNITGGGRKRLETEAPLSEIKPDLVINRQASDEELKWPLPLKKH